MPLYKCEVNAMRWIHGELSLDWVVVCDYRKGRLQCHGCKYGKEVKPKEENTNVSDE